MTQRTERKKFLFFSKLGVLCAFAGVFLVPISLGIVDSVSAQDLDRGLENYSALIKKKKSVADLSVKEFDEVMLVFRRIVDETNARRSGVPLSYKSQEIEVAHREKIFIINGSKYQAKTTCFDFERGDKVLFLEGLPLGPCVTTELLNLRNDTVCRIWCQPDSGLMKSKSKPSR